MPKMVADVNLSRHYQNTPQQAWASSQFCRMSQVICHCLKHGIGFSCEDGYQRLFHMLTRTSSVPYPASQELASMWIQSVVDVTT